MLNWTPRLGPDHAPRREPGSDSLALAVCGSGATNRILIDGACGARVVTTSFRAVDAALTRHRPNLVLANAVSWEFDALDLGLRLIECGYAGRFVVVARGVPAPTMVRAEIERACPDLELEVLWSAPAEPQLLRAI